MQLTFPPAQVLAPSVSPDGTQVAYTTSAGEIRLISMDGGSPQMIAKWSGRKYEISVAPDGSLVFTRNTGTQEIYALTVKWP